MVIRLFDESGTEIASTTTGSDGRYSFPSMQPGTYRVEETQPAGYDNGVVAPSNSVAVTLAQSETRTDVNFSEVAAPSAPSGPLAFSGSTTQPLVIGALVLMLLGMMLLVGVRRRT